MSWLEELERLAELKQQGLLTDEEFQARKAAITPSASAAASTRATETAVIEQRESRPAQPAEQPVTAGLQNWWSFGDLSVVGDRLAKVLRRLALCFLVLSWISTIGVLILTLDDDTSPFVDYYGDVDVFTALGFSAGWVFGMTIYGFLILAVAYLVKCKAAEQ
jgi:hypothetical protein